MDDDGVDPGAAMGGTPVTPAPHVGSEPPAERAGLDPRALRIAYQVVGRDRDRFAARFFEILFDRYPDLHHLFPDDLDWAGLAVSSILDTVVAAADEPEALVTLAGRLGVDNRTIGVLDEHYAPIGHALVLAARSVGGSEWTPTLERAWVDGFDIVAELMVSGAAGDRARGRPFLSGTVVDHVRSRPDIATVLVRLDEAVLAKPGQHVLVSSPELPGVWRPYHVIPVPADAHEVQMYVRSRRYDGLAATLVRGGVGMTVHVGRPQGIDLLRRIDDRNVLAVAAGTGIAPVLSLVADPAVAESGRRVQIFYGGRTVEDLIALERLESIGRRFPRLDMLPVVTTSGGEARLATTLAGIIGSYADWRRHRVIAAGPTDALEPTLSRLRALGVGADDIIRADRRRVPSSAV